MTTSRAIDTVSLLLVIQNRRNFGLFCLKRHGRRSTAPTRELKRDFHRLPACICWERRLRVFGTVILSSLKTNKDSGISYKDVTNGSTRWWLPVTAKVKSKLPKVSFQAMHTPLLLLKNLNIKVRSSDCACLEIHGVQMSGQVNGRTIRPCGQMNWGECRNVTLLTTAHSTSPSTTICSSTRGRVSQLTTTAITRGSTLNACSSPIKKQSISISNCLRMQDWMKIIWTLQCLFASRVTD